MISKTFIKQQTIVNLLNKDLQTIHDNQHTIAYNQIFSDERLKNTEQARVDFNTKKYAWLLKYVNQKPNFVQASGDTFIAVNNLPMQLRFLDMKKFGNWRIYNAELWGVLYNNSFYAIKYTIGDDIARMMEDQLRGALAEDALKADNSMRTTVEYGRY